MEKKMKIKLTTFYALRAIRTIYTEETSIVTSTVIARKEGIPQGVLTKILRALNKAEILTVHQGRGEICGGFSLNRDVNELRLLEVVEVMEGIDICSNLSDEMREKDKRLFTNADQINRNIRSELQKYTLRDLFKM